ncbi:MAG TPA: hypothetical protein VII32_13850 [Thermoanaerobaculia bacterium]
MFRYLKEAFWARPDLGGLGRVPWNALIVAGAVILGFGEHSVWIGALGLETLYLYALATNARFQHWVDAKDLARVRSTDDTARTTLLQHLAPAVRNRVESLEQKIGKVEELYRESQADDFLFDSNREALHKLANIYLRLLIAQRNITTMGTEANEKALQSQIDQIKKDLAGNIPSTLRESKQATLNICVQRLSNLRRRSESLAEIESDLTRIEAQIELALEDASLKGKPTAISGNIDLVSHLLIDDTSATTTSSSGQVLEN